MRSLPLIALLLMTGLVSGCGGSGSGAAPAAAVLNSVTITGSVVDAKPDANGNSVGIDATVTALNLSTNVSLPVVNNGLGSYTVSFPRIPASDVTVAITATKANYLTNSTSVTIKSGSSSQAYQALSIPMIYLDTANAPAGVVVSKSVPGTLTVNGGLTTATLAAGTTLVTAAGTPLDSASLSVISTTYPQDANLMVPVVPNTIFTTAGFTDVSVRDGVGNMAATLDKPVTIRMEVAANTANPDTGEVMVKGSNITIFTYVKSSGTWEQDAKAKDVGSYQPSTTLGSATVQQDDPAGALYVKFETTHFSYWNLGFVGLLKCPTLPNISFTPVSDVALTMLATNPTVKTVMSAGVKPPADPTVTLQNVPKSGVTTMKFYYAGVSAGTITITNCVMSPNPPVVTLTLPAIIPVNVQRVCKYPVGAPTPQTQGLSGVTVFQCSLASTTLDGTCTIASATNTAGLANVRVASGTKLWLQPTNTELAQFGVGAQSIYYGPGYTANVYGADAVRGKMVTAATGLTVSYVDGLWEFCTTTGAN